MEFDDQNSSLIKFEPDNHEIEEENTNIAINGSFNGNIVTTSIVPSVVKKSNYSVNISIEPNHECEIQEIKYDGDEIYKE